MGKTPAQDLAVMRDAVFFEGSTVTQKLSRFWILLVLASIIASAGVVGDSTPAVILRPGCPSLPHPARGKHRRRCNSYGAGADRL